jgi:putative SOS response-associated peptidase YedK
MGTWVSVPDGATPMCGRFTLTSPSTEVASFFGIDDVPPLFARYNIAPMQPIATVRLGADGRRELHEARWGLVPSWAKDPAKGGHAINARTETLAEKPSFRGLLNRRRCLVPADAWYEWRAEGGRKQPYAIRAKDGGLLAFAGLWDVWGGGGVEVLEKATVITTGANDLLRPLHERMPVILPPDAYAAWLDPKGHPFAEVVPLLRAYPDDRLTYFPVGTYVSNARNQGPGCLEPAGPSMLS